MADAPLVDRRRGVDRIRLASPLLAKLTPQLLKALPDMPPGLAEMIPEPTLTDAVAQYLKNLSQFGILLALLMSMGAMAQEKERGTAALVLFGATCSWLPWLAGTIPCSCSRHYPGEHSWR